jgi:hypothetical protein
VSRRNIFLTSDQVGESLYVAYAAAEEWQSRLNEVAGPVDPVPQAETSGLPEEAAVEPTTD